MKKKTLFYLPCIHPTTIEIKKPQLIENQYDEVLICTGGETRTLTPCGTRS